MRIIFYLALVAIVASCSAKTARNEGAATASLDALKQLAGKWESSENHPATGKKAELIYRVTSGGKAVEEIIFPHSSHEMVSMYTQEGRAISMVHYCMLGNQPELRAESTEGSTINFEFVGGRNLNPSTDHHIHGLKLTFLEKDRIVQEWTSFKDGVAEPTMKLEFVRLNG